MTNPSQSLKMKLTSVMAVTITSLTSFLNHAKLHLHVQLAKNN